MRLLLLLLLQALDSGVCEAKSIQVSYDITFTSAASTSHHIHG